ncbi:MAG: LysR substrate-binding domain-containing protein [Bacteroidota bacterium]
MTFQQLEYALCLERYGSFTRSARFLGISQPALSLQIKKLEEFLGITLFDRSKNEISPTFVGLKFLTRAKDLIQSVDELTEFAKELSQQKEGELTVGIIPTLAPYLVPLFAASFLEKYPMMRLQVQEALTEDILQAVRRGEFDAGIISTPLRRSGIQSEVLFYEQFFFYKHDLKAGREDIDPDELVLDDLWILEEGNCFRDQVTDLCAFEERTIGTLQYVCSSIDSLIRMVDFIGGSTILPELTTLNLSENQEQDLRPIQNRVREISFISRKQTGKEQIFGILQQHILESLPSRMRRLGSREIVDPGIKPEWTST